MITSAVIATIALLLNGIIVLLPAGEALPSTASNAFTWLGTESYKWDYIFPITTVWIIVGIMIPVLVAYFFWNGVQWLISFIRGN